MEYKTLKNGFKMPVLGLGTWAIGGEREIDHSLDKEWIAAIKEAIELGLTHIDTAEMYGCGHAEELIAKAITDREKLFITSKVYPTNLKYDDLIKAAEGSLKRLKTKYLDLYLLHNPNPDIPIEETMKAMNYLKEEGMIKNIGVSNFSGKQLGEASKHGKILLNQIEYSLLVRNQGLLSTNMEKEIIPYCQKNDIFIQAWRPLCKGMLAKPGIPTLDKLFKKYNKSRGQIALNWLLSKKNVITIVKSSNLEHLKENLGCLGWKLSKEDVGLLDNKFL